MYQSTDYTDITLWEIAVKTVICGGVIVGPCDYSSYVNPNGAAFAGLTIETQDRIWNTYKHMYLSEKAKVNQIFVDIYAIKGDFYNGYIGEETPTMPNYTGFLYYPDYLSTGVLISGSTYSIVDFYTEAVESLGDAEFPWYERDEVALFSEKVKRFFPRHGFYDAGIPEIDMVDDLEAEVDAQVYLTTGKCGLLIDTEMLLANLAIYGLLSDGSTANLEDYPFLTSALYGEDGMGGSDTYTSDIIVHSDIVGGNLKIQSTNAETGNFTLSGGGTMKEIFISTPTLCTWDEVIGLEMMYYIPESGGDGVYNFEILAQIEVLEMGEIVYKEEVLTGTTEIIIGDCYGPGLEDPYCEKDEAFANDLRAVFDELYGVSSFTIYTDISLFTTVGGWYMGSELFSQMGDNPDGSIAELTSTATGFSIKTEGVNRELIVYFGAIPTNIDVVTGATYDLVLDQVTIHYIDDVGVAQTIVGTITQENGDGDAKDFINLDCMCGAESLMSEGLEILMNELIDYGTFLDEMYATEATEVLLGMSETAASINSFTTDLTSFKIVLDSEDGVLQCDIVLVREDGSTADISTIVSIYGVEVRESADPGITFTLTAYGVLSSGEIVFLIMNPLSSHHGGGCFQELKCDDCVPVTIAPQSCTQEWIDYHAIIDPLNTVLEAEDDYYDEEAFPTYDTSAFCNTRLAYSVDAYLEYLGTDGFNITTTEDENYISLSTFASTSLNAYYLDSDENGIIDPIELYYTYDSDALNPSLTWGEYIDLVYLEDSAICPPNPLGYYPDITFDFPCEMFTANTDTINAKNQEDIYMEKLAESFRQRYVEEAIASLVENFSSSYNDKEFHYTLYYYDQAGNLIQTVPPKGVDRIDASINNTTVNTARSTHDEPDNTDDATHDVIPVHTFETQYHYNSLNQLVWQNTPDGGESYFGYDELGRLVISQNAKQKAYEDDGITGDQEQFSYTRYDGLGRIIEVGEVTLTGDYGFNANGQFLYPGGLLVDVANTAFPTYLLDFESTEEVTRTKYDELSGAVSADFENYSSDNTRNRITGVYYYEEYTSDVNYTNFDNATFYDYDVHGNVKELIQVNKDQDLIDLDIAQTKKKTKYEYDLVSGNVNHVTYQADQVDQFIHEYEYDSDNRITNVRTSKDEVIWEQDAKYFYYDHGPLARTEIGDKKVQSSDYAYTIQGWLKGVNSENLNANKDQGKDSKSGTINEMNGIDVFGYSLHYFENDYTARHGNDFLALSSTAIPHVHDRDLFNGNIKEMYTASTNTLESYIGTSHTWYEYDQLNRIKDMQQERVFDGATENRYASTYSFDSNGNLETLTRDAWNGSSMVAIDTFIDHYVDPLNNNKLAYVQDDLGVVLDDDLADQSTYEGADMGTYDGISNYNYDQIGQLIQDKQEEIKRIEWKVTGKVHKIIRKTGSTKSNLEFVYDAMGNRIMKIETNNAGDFMKKVYYIRDAQGNCMSIYTLLDETVDATPTINLYLTERNIYGSSRVGTENINEVIASTVISNININTDLVQISGDKRYELSNYLGNVLEVVSDRKLQLETFEGSGVLDYYTADVVAQSDYYPFGMLLPNTNIDPSDGSVIEEDNDYRYAFNGMEKDDEMTGSEGQSYDFGARFYNPRVGRWFKSDPLEQKYPYASPYNFVLNTPVMAIDPDGKDVILIIWATHTDASGQAVYGHAAIAVSNYKTQTYQVMENGASVTKTRQVKDGTYTYYDLWPGEDIDGDGEADVIGSAGPADAFTGPPAFYQVKDELGSGMPFNVTQGFIKGTIVTENVLINGDVSEGEGRAPDGVIRLYSDYIEDIETRQDLTIHMALNRSYTSVLNNCSDLAVNGVAESLDTYESIIEFFADESFWISFTTPNGLYTYVEDVVEGDASEGKVLKDPGNLVEIEFEEVIIGPMKESSK